MDQSVVDNAELIKWWDAHDMLLFGGHTPAFLESGLEMARKCRHPDAQWLAALFPPGTAVTMELMREVMLKQGEDARALFLAWRFGAGSDVHDDLLQRSAEMGYAPAQVIVAGRAENPSDGVKLAERACDSGYRVALSHMGLFLFEGWHCSKDTKRGLELLQRAIELESSHAQHFYGEWAYGRLDWERYDYWGRAASRRFQERVFVNAVVHLLPCFETGKFGRILFVSAPPIRAHLDIATKRVFRNPVASSVLRRLQRVVKLYEAMLGRARAAVVCWSMAGRRMGVVKDIRVMVAKMAWREPWVWADKRE
jgi:hypothetical protein